MTSIYMEKELTIKMVTETLFRLLGHKPTQHELLSALGNEYEEFLNCSSKAI